MKVLEKIIATKRNILKSILDICFRIISNFRTVVSILNLSF
jgi:hypothetical protein